MTTPFDAAPSLTGYLYQCRYALLESLRRARPDPAFGIRVEALDDVQFDSVEGTPAELLQLKHHQARSANLSDASVDIWKTLRIWCEGFASGQIAADVVLYLVTTAKAPAGSAAAFLGRTGRSIEVARQRLDSVAQSSTNETNLLAYAAYKKLDLTQREAVLARAYIVDLAPDIRKVDDDIVEELRWAAPRDQGIALVSMLEGWWFRRVIVYLTGDKREAIGADELEAQVIRLQRQLQPDDLPIDDDLHDIDVNEEQYASHDFVKQLQLINTTGRRLILAMKDYLQAYTQRSTWMRINVLRPGELSRYDKRLQAEWSRRFETMKEEVGDYSLEDVKRREGRRLYSWVEKDASVKIRPNCDEPFITRGSYHLLSDRLVVGWHPDFSKRLQGAVEGAEP